MTAREEEKKKKSMDPGPNRNIKQDPGYLLSSVTVMFKPAEGWPRWSGSEGVKTRHLQVDACKVTPALFNTLKVLGAISRPYTSPLFFSHFKRKKLTDALVCILFVWPRRRLKVSGRSVQIGHILKPRHLRATYQVKSREVNGLFFSYHPNSSFSFSQFFKENIPAIQLLLKKTQQFSDHSKSSRPHIDQRGHRCLRIM